MSVLKKCSVAIKAVICTVIISLAMPALALADKGHEREGGRRHEREKHEKFSNNFDRDGRWDRDDDDHDGRKRGRSRKFKRNHDHHNWQWTFRQNRRHDRHGFLSFLR